MMEGRYDEVDDDLTYFHICLCSVVNWNSILNLLVTMYAEQAMIIPPSPDEGSLLVHATENTKEIFLTFNNIISFCLQILDFLCLYSTLNANWNRWMPWIEAEQEQFLLALRTQYWLTGLKCSFAHHAALFVVLQTEPKFGTPTNISDEQ